MAKKEIPQEVSSERGKIPDSLRRIVEKLPTPQAIKVLEDIGKVGWVIDNNNNNNNKASVLQDKIMENVVQLPADKLRQLL